MGITRLIFRTDGLPHQSLGGIGQTVNHIGGHFKHMQQDHVGRNDRVAVAGTAGGEPCKGKQQTYGADHHVGIRTQQLFEFCNVENERTVEGLMQLP